MLKSNEEGETCVDYQKMISRKVSQLLRFLQSLPRVGRLTVAVCLCGSMAACGGGGGGSNSNDEGGTGVRVLHASIDTVPVDVISSADSSVVVSQATFASNAGYRSVRAGSQILSLTKAFNSNEVFESFALNYSDGERYSILVFGDHGSLGVRTAVISDVIPPLSNAAAVRVVNGVTGASSLSVTSSAAPTQEVAFGEAGEYALVQPGVVAVTSRRSADGAVASNETFTAEAGKAYTVLVAGELGYFSKGVVFTDN